MDGLSNVVRDWNTYSLRLVDLLRAKQYLQDHSPYKGTFPYYYDFENDKAMKNYDTRLRCLDIEIKAIEEMHLSDP